MLAVALACGSAAADRGTSQDADPRRLFVYSWPSYLPQSVMDRFEAEFGVEIILDVYTSNAGLIASLRQGDRRYDIAMPSDSIVPALIEDSLIVAFDATGLPNFQRVVPPHDNPPFDPMRLHSVPYLWGTTGIAYDTSAIANPIEESWSLAFSPRTGSTPVAFIDDAGDVTASAAFFLGIEPCGHDPMDWQAIQDMLAGALPAPEILGAGAIVDALVQGERDVAVVWSGTAHRAWLRQPSIGYFQPKEGSVLWSDNVVIPHTARNIEGARAFLNFLMRPDIAAAISNDIGYMNAIVGAAEFLDDPALLSPAIIQSAGQTDRLQWATPCPDAVDALRAHAWDAVREAAR